MPVALRVQELREKRGWSQSELSRRSGVPQATISRIELGKTGGVAFDPQGPGTTAVAASIPGFIATDAASQDVTVSTPGITMTFLPTAICPDTDTVLVMDLMPGSIRRMVPTAVSSK